MRRAVELPKSALAWGLVALLILPWSRASLGQSNPPPTFKPEQLEQLVAPIALYPDALLAQVLMASTYPMEVVEAARWEKANPNLQGQALDDALQQQDWDPSVKSLVSFPQVLEMMDDKLEWTQQLGDAFLAQQSDIMDAVQRLRNKANDQGSLKSNEQQTVTVQQVPNAPPGDPPTMIVIEPANPQVVYVPTYNPTVVYGAWPYPAYPPYAYYPPGYVAGTALLSFGVGMAVGASLYGGCNWGGGWGHGDVNVNVNRFNNYTNNVTNSVNRSNVQNKYQNGNWQHDANHRKGVQYRDQATQQRFNKGGQQGAASRDAFRGRAEQGRQEIAREGVGNVQRDLGNRGGVGGNGPGGANQAGRGDLGNRGGAGGSRPGGGSQPGAGGGQPGQGGRTQGGASNRMANTERPGGGAGADNRGGGGAGNRGSERGSGGAFQGVGNSSQTRRDSTRGESSRQSASNYGSRGGGGGGAARTGGGGAGRAGGGGGARGGGGGRR